MRPPPAARPEPHDHAADGGALAERAGQLHAGGNEEPPQGLGHGRHRA